MRTRLLWLAPALFAAGCTVGPNYKRPAVKVPDTYRGAPAAAAAASVADKKWAELFDDETLKQLVTEALERNLDLAIASERVQQARARFRITQAEEFPFLYAQGQFTLNRPSRNGSNRASPTTGTLDAS